MRESCLIIFFIVSEIRLHAIGKSEEMHRKGHEVLPMYIPRLMA